MSGGVAFIPDPAERVLTFVWGPSGKRYHCPDAETVAHHIKVNSQIKRATENNPQWATRLCNALADNDVLILRLQWMVQCGPGSVDGVEPQR